MRTEDATPEDYDELVSRFNKLAAGKDYITEEEWNGSFKEASPATQEIMRTVWTLSDVDKNNKMTVCPFSLQSL